MDEIGGFLQGPRARNAFVVTSIFDPPWAIRIQDEVPLTVVVASRGDCWIRHDGDAARRLAEGDVALIRGPDAYTVGDAPDSTAQVVIHPGQVCTDLTGRSLSIEMALGVRSWGTDPDGGSVLVTGAYTGQGELAGRLLSVLPRLAVLGRDEWHCPYVRHLADEATVDRAGQTVVLDRLLDLVLLHALRAWFDRPEADTPGWYAAKGDPVVGPTLQAMHDSPAQPWTVARLADVAGVSRSLLARRFTDLVGESPMAYLAEWRLTIAADLLVERELTVASIAARVGYSSPFTFSTAFKRRFGASPAQYRAAAVADLGRDAALGR